MTRITAIIFDLGGTLLEFPEWEAESAARWRATYHLLTAEPTQQWEEEGPLVSAMIAAESEHWRRVDTEHTSGPPSTLILDGFRSLGIDADARSVLAVLDAYARAVDGWARPYADAVPTLAYLRQRGYRIGLLSNTWWAAAWHDADLALHGLAPYIDACVYTSDLAHSKPHPEAFRTVAERLGAAAGECVMVGDRAIDDVGGALAAGMHAVLKTNGMATTIPAHVVPSAVVAQLAELPGVLDRLAGDQDS
jgi:HAD superfamily hydrolase (TIGR01509 family)